MSQRSNGRQVKLSIWQRPSSLKRNAAAMALGQSKHRQRIIQNRKIYSRKNKKALDGAFSFGMVSLLKQKELDMNSTKERMATSQNKGFRNFITEVQNLLGDDFDYACDWFSFSTAYNAGNSAKQAVDHYKEWMEG